VRSVSDSWPALFLGITLALGGCKPADIGDTTPPTDSVDATDSEDSTEDLDPPAGATDRYDPDHLTLVEGQLDEAEWDALLAETRLYYELVLGPDCLQEPIPNVFEWHPGDVTIDGEHLGEVGFRKKGLIGSLSWTRPSLKVDSDRFVDGQEFADGTEHFTFNNNNQDPGRLHTCLAYSVFSSAGVRAPRCAFASVSINDQDLGVYSNVQPIKDAFLEAHFGRSDGDLYEGTASDFNEEFLVTFEVKSDGSTLEPLQELADALDLPDDALMERLRELIDVEAFITFWAVEGLLAHWDGYTQGTNNFYLYHHPDDGLLYFIPWGADAVYEDPEEDPLYVNGQLALRLYNHPEGRAAFYAELQRLLDEVWDEDFLLSETDRMEALIAPRLLDPDLSAQYMDEVRAFVEARRAAVQGVIDAAAPDHPWHRPERTCVEPIGSVSATFDLTWSSSLDGDPFANSATLSADAYGEPLVSDIVGALAGPDEEGALLLAVVGVASDYSEATQVALVLPPNIEPGTYDVDIAAVAGYVLTVDLSDGASEIVGLLGGEVLFDAIAYEPGAPISGSFEAILLPYTF